MGERSVLTLARRLKSSGRAIDLRYIPGTVFAGTEADLPGPERTVWLPSRDDIEQTPEKLLEATTLALEHAAPGSKHYLAQRDRQRLTIVTEPQRPLTTSELDALYALPFTRRPHFTYREPIPALETVRFSITVHRGCYGGCSFCGLGLHQGKVIQSRSIESIRREIERLIRMPEFKGVITDLGGPTANMYGTRCRKPKGSAPCRRASCLFPAVCPNLDADHEPSLRMLEAVRGIEGIKHCFIASGVRYDLALQDPRYIEVLARHHTGGHLSVAPEHTSDRVLALMGKPGIQTFERFRRAFDAASAAAGKEQYLIPYLISSFPGCTERDMAELRDYLKANRLRTHQTQDFTPLPMTMAAAMYYSGKTPDGRPIPVARTIAEKKRQQHYLKKR